MHAIDYRHEYKHVINVPDYHTLRQRIRLVATPDPHAGADGRYHIRSLYFDSDDDRALREKVAGLPNREKYRIRLYNGCEDFIRLEKKCKVGSLCNKQSVRLTRGQVEQLLAGDTAWMADSGNALLIEFYAKLRHQRLRPKTLVDYWREAYRFPYGNVRITFDADLRTGVHATGLFDPNTPTLRAGEPGLLLLEVKYDRFLPDLIRDLIQTNMRHSESFSKYAACRIYG
ncbi:MAG: polyphosphate polymerase domain-containing protein [Clostridiales bacterium]|nr:polyphosphate polymerase domain-containing protein [Clostridiales bacterium]